MSFQKLAAVATAAAILASTALPAVAAPAIIRNAAPAFRPNWTVVGIFASTASVIVDAMYIAATQCREMTQQEAGIALLPAVGPIINATQPSMSKCKK